MSKKLQMFGVFFIIAAAFIVISNRLNAPSHLSPTSSPENLSQNTASPIIFASETPLVATEVAQQIVPTLTYTPAATPTLPPDAVMHVVQRGETLYRIAQNYGVTMESIAGVNGLADISRIFVGQQLWIPSASLPATLLPTTVSTTSLPTVFAPTITPKVTSAPSILAVSAATTTSVPLIPTAIPPATVNGVPVETIIVLPDAVRANIEQIFLRGLELQRNPRAFSKLGDSTIENPFFLARFDEENYNLGDYVYLQSVIDFYAGSFGRESVAVRRGLHTWSVFDPMWNNSPYCQPREGLLECEIRIHNPSVMFVRLGSNDVGVPEMTEENFRKIIEFLIVNGIIPIMGTKADRHEGVDNANNNMIRRLAAEYNIPLWDFDLVAQTIANRGLDQDAVHMTTFYAHDWTSPVGFQRGHGVHNLTALIALDAVWHVIAD
jgi:LysM repeat protein